MNKLFSQITLVAILVVTQFPTTVQAQFNNLVATRGAAPTTVTFTFQIAPTDYSVYLNNSGKPRYCVRVPTSNIPSFKVDPAGALRVTVDNDQSTNDSLVFCVPVV